MTDAAIKKPDSGIAGEFAENLGLLTPLERAWHYQELIRAVVRRELVVRFRGSILGWLWAIFGPLLMLSVYTVIFSHAVGVPASTRGAWRRPIIRCHIFVGLIVFNLFRELAYRAPGLLHEHVNFIKKSIFPSETLAWTAAIRAAVYAGISFCVLLVFELIITHKLPLTVLLLPFVFVPFFLFLLGASWFLMALGSFTRDVMHLMVSIVPGLHVRDADLLFNRRRAGEPDDFPSRQYRRRLCGDDARCRSARQIPNPWLYLGTVIVSLLVFRFGYRFLHALQGCLRRCHLSSPSAARASARRFSFT